MDKIFEFKLVKIFCRRIKKLTFISWLCDRYAVTYLYSLYWLNVFAFFLITV